MLVKEATQTPQFLHWRDRPEKLNDEINRVFSNVALASRSSWGIFNGSKTYNLCGMDENLLVDRLIEEAPASRKDFYFLDIGAENFEWGKSLAEHLSTKPNLPKDLTFHIISIRGERYDGPEEKVHGPCKIYNIGFFQIENLEDAFATRLPKLPLHVRVDLAVSHYSFRYLVDPLGTFLQAYHLIRPESGIFAFDGFFFEDGILFFEGGKVPFNEKIDVRMASLLCETNAIFLMKQKDWHRDGGLSEFLLRRPNADPLQLPYKYKGYKSTRSFSMGWVTQFERTDDRPPQWEWVLPKRNFLSGDRKFFEWMKQKVGFGSWAKTLLSYSWGPLLKHQKLLKPPQVHQAIVLGDRDDVITLLDNGSSIDESDEDGNTPLHIAILHNKIDLFRLLLDRGANPMLLNGEGILTLHLAVDKRNVATITKLIRLRANWKINDKRGQFLKGNINFLTKKNLKKIEQAFRLRLSGLLWALDGTKLELSKRTALSGPSLNILEAIFQGDPILEIDKTTRNLKIRRPSQGDGIFV